MSSPEEPVVHHCPTTTALWVTSPLAELAELQHNSLEPTPRVKSSVQIALLLIIGSSVLAVAVFILRSFLADVIASMGLPLYIWLIRIADRLDRLQLTAKDGQDEARLEQRRDLLPSC